MTPLDPRDRPWPAPDLTLPDSVVEYLAFVHTTCVNKLAGLDEAQARATPLATSPVLSPLGLVKHLTAVYRQHIQIHVGRQDLPSLWRAYDHARHLGHLDVVRELIDGARGE